MALRPILCALMFALSGLGVPPSAADTPRSQIAGAQNDRFEVALQLWLDGEDFQALTDLKSLSESGNTAAQIFLGRVSVTGHLHSYLTAPMARKDRIALLRQEGGVSGKSWLYAARETEPLAGALIDMGLLGKKSAAVQVLHDYGERTSASLTLSAMLHSGDAAEVRDVLRAARHKSSGPDVVLLDQAVRLLQGGGEEFAGRARMSGAWSDGDGASETTILPTDWLVWAPFGPTELRDKPEALQIARRFAPDVLEWTPIRRLCTAHCPNSVDSCTALGSSLTGNKSRPFPFSSPSEALLSNARYWASARIELDVVRRMPDLRDWPQVYPSVDACAGPVFQALQRKAL